MRTKELYCFFLPISYEYKFLVYVNDEDNKGPYMFNPSINRYCMLYGWTTSKKLAKKFIEERNESFIFQKIKSDEMIDKIKEFTQCKLNDTSLNSKIGKLKYVMTEFETIIIHENIAYILLDIIDRYNVYIKYKRYSIFNDDIIKACKKLWFDALSEFLCSSESEIYDEIFLNDYEERVNQFSIFTYVFGEFLK